MNDQQSVGIEFNADKTEVTITPRETPIRLTANDLSEVIARLREIRAEMSPPVAMAVGLSMPAHSMMQGNAV